MKFLLIGGVGYLGGRLATYLKTQGHYVRVTTRRPLAKLPAWLKADDVIQADPLYDSEWQDAFKTIDTVIYLAAPNEIISAENPLESLRAGGEGTWNILQRLSSLVSPPTFIYLSTFHVYGPNASGLVTENTPPAPTHPYALGKYVGECVAQSFRRKKKVQTLIVRLSNSFGAPSGNDVPRWTLVFNDLCRQAVVQKKLVLKTTGLQKRNFIALSDVIRALEFLALDTARWPDDGVIHLGSDRTWSIRQAAEKVSQLSQEVLGSSMPIVIPPDVQNENTPEFQFSVARLKSLGFSWQNEADIEIRDTLKLCVSAGLCQQ